MANQLPTNITTPNPCGQAMPALNPARVALGSVIPITFNLTLQPTIRIYPVINNRAVEGVTVKLEDSPGLICPMPIDIPLDSIQGRVYQWRVEEPVNGTTQVSGSADLRVKVGDFIWFHAEELRNSTYTGHAYETTNNYTIVRELEKSGGVREVSAKSALILLATFAFGGLFALAV